jgi:hypothetical protein
MFLADPTDVPPNFKTFIFKIIKFKLSCEYAQPFYNLREKLINNPKGSYYWL